MRITIENGNPNTLKLFDDNGKQLKNVAVHEFRIVATSTSLKATLICEWPNVDIEIKNEDVKLVKCESN